MRHGSPCGPDSERENRGNFLKNELLLFLATINNLLDATSHVCITSLCEGTVALLQLVVHSCLANIYELVLCVALSSSVAKCHTGECAA